MRHVAVWIVATALAAGCSKSEDKKKDQPAPGKAGDKAGDKADKGGAKVGVFAGACDLPEGPRRCIEYFGVDAEWVKGSCGASGKYLADRCPTQDAIGRCASFVGTPQEMQALFYAPMAPETFDAICSGTDGKPEKRAP